MKQEKIEELLNFLKAHEEHLACYVKYLAPKLNHLEEDSLIFIMGGGYETIKGIEFRRTVEHMFCEAGFKNVVTIDKIISMAEPYESGWKHCEKLMCELCSYTNGCVIELAYE